MILQGFIGVFPRYSPRKVFCKTRVGSYASDIQV